MRRLGKKSKKSSPAKPSDLYTEHGRKSEVGRASTGSSVSMVSYDDLFGVKPNSDAVDKSWQAFEDDLESMSSASNRSTVSDTRSTVSSKKGSKNKKNKKKNHDEEDDDDYISIGSSFSQASFEDVFGSKFGKEEDDYDDFEFSNPSVWRDNAAAKEAVYDVLAGSGSTMEKARKLFLLEQLNRPAPPSEAPDYWSRQSMNLTKASKKKKKRVLGYYDVESGDAAPEMFRTVAELIGQQSKIKLGWPIRVDFVLDSVKLLGRLHQGGYTHGSLRSDNILLDDGLNVYFRQMKTIGPLTKAEYGSIVRTNKMHLDIAGVGILILELSLGKTLSNISCPKLRSAIKLEEKGRFEKLEDLQDAVDKEIRELLTKSGDVPSSLVELCAQCLACLRETRPQADDVIDWLSDLRKDMQDPDTPHKKAVARSLIGNKKLPLKPAQSYDVKKIQVVGEEDLDAGYETDDSYIPPPPPPEQEAAAKKKSTGGSKNKLQAFLNASATPSHAHGGGSSAQSVSGDGGKARPRSMMLPSGVGKTLLNDDDDNSKKSSGTTKPKKLQRRRSLDRGYYYARSRMMENQFDNVKTLVSKANIGKFKEQWKAKQQIVSSKTIDPEALAARLDAQEILSQDEALAIIKKADKVLRQEPNLVQLQTGKDSSITIVGDIHGQYYDLRNLFKIGGNLGKGKGKTTYLFLGDYIDRGDWGAEVLLYLFALKAKYPAHIWLLRGNHEARTVSAFFGFKEECEKKYGLTIYNRCAEAFQAMPIAATVETPAGKFLCLHGGISPNVQSLEQFIEFDRFEEPAMNGFLCDVLWSDPVKDNHEDGLDQTLSDFLSIDFLPNPQRGCSYRYGFRALVSFLAVNGLVGIIRAHEVQEEGYLYHFQELSGGKGDTAAQVTPPVITVFSAPNYCGRYGNKAAFLRIHHKPPGRSRMRRGVGVRPMQLIEPVQFTAVPHPDPITFESEQKRQDMRIETSCPYMPTTFQSFIKKAIELGEEEAALGIMDERKKKHISLQRKKLDAKGKPPQLPPRKLKDDVSDSEDEAQQQKQKKKNWKAAQLLGFDDGGGVAPPPTAGAPPKKTKKKKKKKVNKKYNEAVAQDGINEMNPMLLQDKMKEAQTKLNPDNLHLPENVRLKQGSNRSSLIRKKREPSPEPDVKQAEEQTKPSADAISFTSNELIALQLLFLFVDHQDKGYITRDDLVQWSAEEGVAVPKSEAELVMNYVDADFDGQIGFEDYLVFAAKNKERWLAKQYAQVLGHIKKLQKQSSDPNLLK